MRMTRPHFRNPGATRYAPPLTSGALLVLLGFLGWNSLHDIHKPAATANTGLPTPPVPASPAVSTDSIAEHHLFGVAETLVGPNYDVAPPASWKVVGVVVGDSQADSVADIEINGTEQLWHVGDRLPDGSTLAAIDSGGIKTSGSDNVVPFELQAISYNDRFDTLPLNGGGDFANAPSVPTAHPNKAQPLSARMEVLRAAGIAVLQKRIRDTPRPVPKGKPPVSPAIH